ncbi:hypothetical protein PLESTF_000390000 [Pleodorina starrii]|nr:hypothetical protein PLESTF_000390000 [Pleodorina starrii]
MGYFRQYFVEYRRKLKVSGPARTRGGAGGRAAAKRLGNDEPWQATTSDEDQQQQEDDTDDDTDEEVAQTASLRLRRQQQHMFPRAKPQGQGDDGAAGPDSPAVEEPAAAAAAATHIQIGSAGVAAAEMYAVLPAAAKGGAGLDAAACGPESPRRESSPAAAAAPASAPTSDTQAESPRRILLPVRRARGPMVTRLLRCAAMQPRSGGDARVHQRIGEMGDVRLGLVEGRPGHVDESPRSEIPAAAAAGPAVTNGGSFNACVPQSMHPAAAAASASAPRLSAWPLTASGDEACQDPGAMGDDAGGGGKATAYQQPAVFFPVTAGHWNPGLVGANAWGAAGIPCWTSGGAWHGAPGFTPMTDQQITVQAPNAPQVAAAAAAAAQVQGALPAPGCPAPEAPGAINLASFEGGAGLGSPAAGAASTAPFNDPDLQRTCSVNSICTGGSAAAAGQPQPQSSAPAQAPAAVVPAIAAAGVERACPLSLALSSRPSFGDLSSGVPGSDGSTPSASAAGAAPAPAALQDELTAQQLSCKRRRTVNAPLQLSRGAPLPGFSLGGRHVTPEQHFTSHSAPSSPWRPVGDQEGSHVLPTCTAHGGFGPGACAWAPGACSSGLPAIAATGRGDGAAAAAGWRDPASTFGRQTPPLSATGDIPAAAALPCALPVTALGAVHHAGGAAAVSMAAGQQRQPQHLSQLDPPGGELEPEADILDAEWLDGLLSESEMDFLLAF